MPDEPSWIADPNSAKVYYEVAKSQLDEQFGRVESLDGKAMAIFGLASGALPFFGNALAFAEGDPPTASWFFVALGLFAYGGILYFTYKAYQVGEWSARPQTELLRDRAREYSETEIYWWTAKQFAQSVEENSPILIRKARAVFWTVALLPFEFVFFLVATLAALN